MWSAAAAATTAAFVLSGCGDAGGAGSSIATTTTTTTSRPSANVLPGVSTWDLPDDCRNQTVVEEGGVMPTMSYHIHYVTDNQAVYGDMKTFYEDFIAAFSEHFLSTKFCPFGPNYGAYNSDIFPSKTICSLEGPVEIKYDCGIVADAIGCDIDEPSSGQCMAKLPDKCLPGEHCFANGIDNQCAWCVYDMAQCKSLYGGECENSRHCHDPHRVQEEGGPWGSLYQRAFFVPIELIDKVWEWSKLHKLNLDVLKHPNSGCMHDDHSVRAVWEGTGHPLVLSAFPCNVPGTCCQDNDYPGPPSCGCSGGRASDAPEDSCDNCVVIGDYPPQTTTTTTTTTVSAVPPQFVYTKDVADDHKKFDSGCEAWSWEGLDSYGMMGPPWVTYVQCEEHACHWWSGVATNGDFQVWLVDGSLTANGKELKELGESFWVAAGAAASLTVRGSAYVVGAKFVLDGAAEERVFTSSWQGPKTRTHELADALAGRSNSSFVHDPHICNGTSPSMDFALGSATTVDPATVVVLNCAAGSSPETNFVWSHFHPFGVVYMPLSGHICFASDEVVCAEPGMARWASANLQYYEYFQKINKTNSMAERVRELAGVSSEDCEYPIVFAVTNFDVAYGAGVPNFDDWPVSAHSQTSAVGIGPWGIFPKMTVQATRFVTRQVVVDATGAPDATLV